MIGRSLLKIADLSDSEVATICSRALCSPPRVPTIDPRRSGVGLMFFENSTRTRMSFERAAQLVGRPSLVFDAKTTSLEKGESMEDTLLTLKAIDIKTFVIRTPETGSLEALRKIPDISIINAGDGVGEHPTQALLDAVAMADSLGGRDLECLRGRQLGICGDLRHSRVARSWSELAPRLGITLTFFSPSEWKPTEWGSRIPWLDRKADILPSLDFVMALRVQKERMTEGEWGLSAAFVRDFQLKASELSAKQKLMHPGPVNWDVELSSDFQRDPRSLILAQVNKGLSLRACVLDFLGEPS